MADGVFERHSADDGEVRLELVTQPAISYALVFNGVPLVRSLTVTNLTGRSVTDLTVSLQLSTAGTVLTEPWTRDVALLAPHAEVTITAVDDLLTDTASLGSADESRPGLFTAAVARRWTDDLRVAAPTSLLAGNEWLGAPALVEALSAFVQPNTRSVVTVLQKAAQLLGTRSGSSALDGYQAGPERAAAIAAAVWDVLRDRQIHYVVPPASFESTGQKVRPTAQVLADRLGTCVDLAVTYAACLEAAGLRPLLWLLDSHAMAGYLREETRLPEPVLDDPNQLVNLAEGGTAVPVEVTLLCPGEGDRTFAAAVEAGRRVVRGSADELRALVDVSLSHRTAVRPLPTGKDESIALLDVPADSAAPRASSQSTAAPVDLGAAGGGTRRPATRNPVPARIGTWEKSLLDLSLRNPLLQLPRRGKVLDLHVPAGALPDFDDLVHAGKPLRLVPQDRLSSLHALRGVRRAQELDADVLADELRTDRRVYAVIGEDAYQAKMRGLQRDARTLEQETGSNYLFLTLGALVHPGPTREARAPLFLLPVRIEGGVGNSPYAVRIDGNEVASANHCLQEWLRVRHGVTLGVLADPPLDSSGINITAAFAAARRQLAEAQLSFRIDEDASLAILQFATFQMWRDLTDHWEHLLTNPVVRHLVERPGQTFADPADDGTPIRVHEGSQILPIAADGSQLAAVATAAAGRSFVLEGPPGTGKSQTITNLVADTVARGRSVLFVAEKQAALDVVKDRLTRLGMGPFALDLHGRKQSNRAIREQLVASLNETAGTDPAQWSVDLTRLRRRITELGEDPEQVHGTGPGGWSAWTAHESVLAHGDEPSAPVPVSYLELSPEERVAAEEAARDLPAAVRGTPLLPANPWSLSHLPTTAALDRSVLEQAAADLEAARAGLTALTDHQLRALGATRTATPDLDVLADLAALARLSATGLLPSTADLGGDAPVTEPDSADVLARFDAFQERHALALATVRPEAFTDAPLDQWHTDADAAGHGLFGRGKRRQALADSVGRWVRTGQTVSADAVVRFVSDVRAAREDAAALWAGVTATPGLRLAEPWLPTAPAARDRLADALGVTGRAVAFRRDHPQVWDGVAEPVAPAQAAALAQLAEAWAGWQEVLAVDAVSWTRWTGSRDWLAAWADSGPGWLTTLRSTGLMPLSRWMTVDGHLRTLAAAGLGDFAGALLDGSVPAVEAELALARGCRRRGAGRAVGEHGSGPVRRRRPRQQHRRVPTGSARSCGGGGHPTRRVRCSLPARSDPMTSGVAPGSSSAR